MSAGRVCVKSVDVAEPQESVAAAARRMSDRNVGTLVVVNARGEPIGMLTDRDLTVRVLARGRDPGETTVYNVMTPDPEAITEGTPIEDALRVMRKGPCRRIPVVDETGKLCGVLSLDDILDLFAKEFSSIGKLIRQEAPDSLANIE